MVDGGERSSVDVGTVADFLLTIGWQPNSGMTYAPRVDSGHVERFAEGVSRERIAQYLDATTRTPGRADLIFIPGTRLLNPAWIAADLIARGVAPLVVVTGGINRFTGTNESESLQAELIAQGVAPDQILVEQRSTNTLENVRYAWPLVVDRLGSRPLTSVLAVCKWMHSRRVLMTLKAHFPRGIRFCARTYAPEGITPQAWSGGASVPQIADVIGSWNNVPEYLARGDIAEIVQDGDGSWV